jgi:MFS family permease
MMVSVSYEVPLLAQGVLGQDALHAGFSVAPMSLGWPLASSVAGRFALRVGYRVTAVAGLLIGTVGVALLLLLTEHSSYIEAAIFSFFIGAGLGMSSTPMLVAVQSAVSWQRRGVATAASMFVRNFGGLVGLAVMGAIINHVAGKSIGGGAADRELGAHGHAALPPAVLHHIEHTLYVGIHTAFFAALATTILALLAAALLPGGSAREHEVRSDAPDPEPRQEAPRHAPSHGARPATPQVAPGD